MTPRKHKRLSIKRRDVALHVQTSKTLQDRIVRQFLAHCSRSRLISMMRTNLLTWKKNVSLRFLRQRLVPMTSYLQVKSKWPTSLRVTVRKFQAEVDATQDEKYASARLAEKFLERNLMFYERTSLYYLHSPVVFSLRFLRVYLTYAIVEVNQRGKIRQKKVTYEKYGIFNGQLLQGSCLPVRCRIPENKIAVYDALQPHVPVSGISALIMSYLSFLCE